MSRKPGELSLSLIKIYRFLFAPKLKMFTKCYPLDSCLDNKVHMSSRLNSTSFSLPFLYHTQVVLILVVFRIRKHYFIQVNYSYVFCVINLVKFLNHGVYDENKNLIYCLLYYLWTMTVHCTRTQGTSSKIHILWTFHIRQG